MKNLNRTEKKKRLNAAIAILIVVIMVAIPAIGFFAALLSGF